MPFLPDESIGKLYLKQDNILWFIFINECFWMVRPLKWCSADPSAPPRFLANQACWINAKIPRLCGGGNYLGYMEDGQGNHSVPEIELV